MVWNPPSPKVSAAGLGSFSPGRAGAFSSALGTAASPLMIGSPSPTLGPVDKHSPLGKRGRAELSTVDGAEISPAKSSAHPHSQPQPQGASGIPRAGIATSLGIPTSKPVMEPDAWLEGSNLQECESLEFRQKLPPSKLNAAPAVSSSAEPAMEYAWLELSPPRESPSPTPAASRPGISSAVAAALEMEVEEIAAPDAGALREEADASGLCYFDRVGTASDHAACGDGDGPAAPQKLGEAALSDEQKVLLTSPPQSSIVIVQVLRIFVAGGGRSGVSFDRNA